MPVELLLVQVYRLITSQGQHPSILVLDSLFLLTRQSKICVSWWWWMRRGNEGTAGEEEREDAAVQGHQAAARPAPARRPAHRCSQGGDAAAVARELQIFFVNVLIFVMLECLGE